MSKLKEVLKQIDDVYNASLWRQNVGDSTCVEHITKLLTLKMEVILLLGEECDE